MVRRSVLLWSSCVAVASALAAPDSTCPKWDVTDTTFTNPLVAGLYKTLSPLAVMSPGLGSCLIEAKDLFPTLIGAIADKPGCDVMLSWLKSKPMSDMPLQTTNRTQAQAVALATFMTKVANSNDTSGPSACETYMPGAAQCIIKSVVPALLSSLATPATPCCASWLASYTNPSLPIFVSSLLKYTSNVLCSTQTMADGGVSTCGTAFVHAIIPPTLDMVDLFTRLSDFVVVPNDQGCAAQDGLSFNDTAGSSRMIFTKPAIPFSGCAAPLDMFVQWVKAVPYINTITAFDPDRLFANGTASCLNGQMLLPYLGVFLPMDKPAAMTTIKNVYGKICAHLANSYAPACTFALPATQYAPVAAWPFDPTPAPTTAKPTPKPTTATSAAAASVVASAAAIALLVMQL
ncbi:Aste57867_23813 [Aphanomyces stellatus]|uniref:Aste57867_23813 protein n=1 Tax=Aphanomyces stellatus TaxID=120398 RepID=A0A485LQC2_9STRA|nr:hypothetical protein As57867_023740 [Aphanomyces stellatus]VFU00457.1 Aste57867_23813 [Aphanomyces stellatus]